MEEAKVEKMEEDTADVEAAKQETAASGNYIDFFDHNLFTNFFLDCIKSLRFNSFYFNFFFPKTST